MSKPAPQISIEPDARGVRSVDIRHLLVAFCFLMAPQVKLNDALDVTRRFGFDTHFPHHMQITLLASFLSGCHRSDCCLYAFFEALKRRSLIVEFT